ncbi:Universal stress protein family protein [Hymenobacter daecheongensis DSM 21074]|uniref:Universal stress protein family protein n=1 Tax=Hymenobacter daecheongensis DSM 21074 TaxID=1121955 RepID=A0A1M6MDE0_9BACT|nr:universal stress protein [Hymenobacter daecheongensis]SHJ81471.1 Universal stress protein family protein [Hymenobacter daecheongensis DSM 21074]
MNPPAKQPASSTEGGAARPALTFIVLTSFFPEARRALRFGAALAGALGGRLVLLHVNQLALLAGDELHLAEPPQVIQQLRQALQTLTAGLPVPASMELVTDLLPDGVEALARRYGPAVFVVGRPANAQTDTDISAAVLEVLRNARLPLLLVPETYAGPTLPRQLAIAADEEPFGLPAGAGAAQQLLHQLPALPATVVTASPMQDDMACAAALHHVRTSRLLPDRLPSPTVAGFYGTHPEDGLLQALTTTQADWLVLPARRRSVLGQLFHRSVTSRLLRNSPVPVLVVPATDA